MKPQLLVMHDTPRSRKYSIASINSRFTSGGIAPALQISNVRPGTAR